MISTSVALFGLLYSGSACAAEAIRRVSASSTPPMGRYGNLPTILQMRLAVEMESFLYHSDIDHPALLTQDDLTEIHYISTSEENEHLLQDQMRVLKLVPIFLERFQLNPDTRAAGRMILTLLHPDLPRNERAKTLRDLSKVRTYGENVSEIIDFLTTDLSGLAKLRHLTPALSGELAPGVLNKLYDGLISTHPDAVRSLEADEALQKLIIFHGRKELTYIGEGTALLAAARACDRPVHGLLTASERLRAKGIKNAWAIPAAAAISGKPLGTIEREYEKHQLNRYFEGAVLAGLWALSGKPVPYILDYFLSVRSWFGYQYGEKASVIATGGILSGKKIDQMSEYYNATARLRDMDRGLFSASAALFNLEIEKKVMELTVLRAMESIEDAGFLAYISHATNRSIAELLAAYEYNYFDEWKKGNLLLLGASIDRKDPLQKLALFPALIEEQRRRPFFQAP